MLSHDLQHFIQAPYSFSCFIDHLRMSLSSSKMLQPLNYPPFPVISSLIHSRNYTYPLLDKSECRTEAEDTHAFNETVAKLEHKPKVNHATLVVFNK